MARVEAPDAAGVIENRTRIFAWRLGRAVALLTGIGRRADAHVQHAVGADDDALGGVLSLIGEAADDGVGGPVRRELTDLPVPAHHGVVGREVEILAGERDAGASADAERADDVGFAISGRVAQQSDAALRARGRDEQVAVLEHHHVARGADRFRDDQGAESGLQRESRVIGSACWPSGLWQRRDKQRRECGEKKSASHEDRI